MNPEQEQAPLQSNDKQQMNNDVNSYQNTQNINVAEINQMEIHEQQVKILFINFLE